MMENHTQSRRWICGVTFHLAIDNKWVSAMLPCETMGVCLPAAAFDAADPEAIWQALEVEIDHYWPSISAAVFGTA